MKDKNRTSFLDWLKVRLATTFWTCSRIDSGERPESTGGGDFNPVLLRDSTVNGRFASSSFTMGWKTAEGNSLIQTRNYTRFPLGVSLGVCWRGFHSLRQEIQEEMRNLVDLKLGIVRKL